MKNHSKTPIVSVDRSDCKFIEKAIEKQVFLNYLKENTVSCTMFSNAIGVPQKHLTRYKKFFEERNLLWIVKIDRCQSTGRNGVQYLTTDHKKAPQNSVVQLDLFQL